VRLSFHGADRDVTGSCHLVECAGRRILIDCGMYQGGRGRQLSPAVAGLRCQPLADSREPSQGADGATTLKTSVRMDCSTDWVSPRATHLAISVAASMASVSPEISFRESAHISRPKLR